MNDKRRKAEVLLDAIGEMDDIYLAEAMSYKKKKRNALSRLLVIAATLILATVIPFSAIVGASVVGVALIGINHLNFGQAGDNNEAVPDEVYMEDSLSFLMVGISDSGSYRFCENEDSIPYADGNAYLVWQYEGESGYHMSQALSDRELDVLIANMGHGKEVGDDSPKLRCKVWLLLEDGRVISPYLKVSAGNISNSVFDYEAEITPTDALADHISDILN